MAIAAGDIHSLALKADGTVVGWGYNGYGQTTIPAGLTNVVAIAAGDNLQSGAQGRRHGRRLGRQLLRRSHRGGNHRFPYFFRQ